MFGTAAKRRRDRAQQQRGQVPIVAQQLRPDPAPRVPPLMAAAIEGRDVKLWAAMHGPRPVKWCTRLSASSSPDVYAAAEMAITSSCSSAGSASALASDSMLR